MKLKKTISENYPKTIRYTISSGDGLRASAQFNASTPRFLIALRLCKLRAAIRGAR